MISEKDILLAKQTSIVDYLLSQGHRPSIQTRSQLVYFSPFTNESTPSFFVCPKENVWNDFSSNDKGDIIRLVRKLTKCTFKESIEILLNFHQSYGVVPSVSIDQNHYTSDGSSLHIHTVKRLENRGLIAYLNKRNIPLNIASKYLEEAYFSIDGHLRKNGKPYFALAFKNDKDGFELRADNFKSCNRPKALTTFNVPGSSCINLFEGFFDFLSALAFFKVANPTYTTIILNSLSFVGDAAKLINNYDKVNIFFDNDTHGLTDTNYLKSCHSNVIDQSHIYQGYKDFNDFLSQKPMQIR